MAKARKSAAGSKEKGRQPLEWTALVVQGVFLGELGVYASKTTNVRSVSLTDDPNASVKLPKDSVETAPRSRSSKKQASEVPVEPKTLFVRIQEGKNLDQTFPLTEEQCLGYQEFEAKFNAVRGIHVRKFVPGAAVAGFPTKNVFYLAPREGVGDTVKAYRCLHELLYAQYLAALAHRIHGKGFDPVAIMAVEKGLVMWQLPEYGSVHNISDVVPSKWQTAEVPPQERTLFAKLVEQLTKSSLRAEDLQNPLSRRLEKLALGLRDSSTMPTSSCEDQYPNLLTALEALVR
jgi:hypothetical protein